MAQNKNSSSGLMKGLLAGAAVAAVAAGAYLASPAGAKKRAQIRGWAIKARGEVVQELEKMKDVSQDKYDAAVDKVTARYAKMKEVGEKEASSLNRDLKKHWREIKKAVSGNTGKTGSTGKAGNTGKTGSAASRKK